MAKKSTAGHGGWPVDSIQERYSRYLATDDGLSGERQAVYMSLEGQQGWVQTAKITEAIERFIEAKIEKRERESKNAM